MKKEHTLFVFLFFMNLFLLNIFSLRADAVQSVDVSISISGIPGLVLAEPLNGTYLVNVSLPLSFLVDGADNLWYNVDDGNNITVTGNTFFNTTAGPHILRLIANNSAGIAEENVTFAVNLTKLIIIYDKYKGAYRGNSTDFYRYTYEQLGNLENLTLENTIYGRMRLYDTFNLTADGSLIDFDNNTNISFNKISFMGLSNIPSNTTLLLLNKKAIMWLYNLTFASPVILRNGVSCPEQACRIISYQNGTLNFNATIAAAVYSAAEYVPVTPTPTGGGITPIPVPEKNLRVNPKSVEIELFPGESVKRTLSIKNSGKTPLQIIIDSNLGDFFSINNQSYFSFALAPNEEMPVDADFNAKISQKPGVYFGYVSVRGDGNEEIVLVSVTVKTFPARFNIDVLIPPEYKTIKPEPGQELKTQITIFNITTLPGLEADVAYTIKDSSNNIVLETTEKRLIQEQSYFKTFALPSLAEGNYLFYASMKYANSTASDSETFIVTLAKPLPPNVIVVPVPSFLHDLLPSIFPAQLAVPVSTAIAISATALAIGAIIVLLKIAIKLYLIGKGVSAVWSPFKKI